MHAIVNNDVKGIIHITPLRSAVQSNHHGTLLVMLMSLTHWQVANALNMSE